MEKSERPKRDKGAKKRDSQKVPEQKNAKKHRNSKGNHEKTCDNLGIFAVGGLHQTDPEELRPQEHHHRLRVAICQLTGIEDFEKAVERMKYLYFDFSEDTGCVCKHRIEKVHHIVDRETQKEYAIGSSCITYFPDSPQGKEIKELAKRAESAAKSTGLCVYQGCNRNTKDTVKKWANRKQLTELTGVLDHLGKTIDESAHIHKACWDKFLADRKTARITQRKGAESTTKKVEKEGIANRKEKQQGAKKEQQEAIHRDLVLEGAEEREYRESQQSEEYDRQWEEAALEAVRLMEEAHTRTCCDCGKNFRPEKIHDNGGTEEKHDGAHNAFNFCGDCVTECLSCKKGMSKKKGCEICNERTLFRKTFREKCHKDCEEWLEGIKKQRKKDQVWEDLIQKRRENELWEKRPTESSLRAPFEIVWRAKNGDSPTHQEMTILNKAGLRLA